MANGALTPDEELKPEDQALLAKVDAAQEKEFVGSMSGPDRMVVDQPKVDPNLDARVKDYKKSTKDVDLDGKKDPMWKRVKAWGGGAWNKGKDDPNTEIREDETVEVTRFMGGMTRQELGMFIFQWGGLMMQNSDEGFGGAAGAAGLGAMEGHQSRQREAAETEASSAQQNIENQMKQQTADAATASAGANVTRADAYATGLGSVRGGVGEWKREFYRSIGWSDEKIAQAAEGILTTEQIFDEVSTDLRDQRAKASAKETMKLPDNMRAKTRLPDGTEIPTAQLTEDQILMLASEASKKQVEARGALNPAAAPNPEDAFSNAMDQYGTKP